MNRLPPFEVIAWIFLGAVIALVVGLICLAKLWANSGKTGDANADYARRMRRTGCIWFVPLLLFATLSMLVALAIDPKDPGSRSVWWVMAGMFAAAAISVRARYRRHARSGVKKPVAALANRGRAGSAVTWAIVAYTILIVILWLANPGEGRGNNFLLWMAIASPIVFVLIIVGRLALLLRKYRDGAVMRAFHRSEEGDIDGAIAELQHEIEMRGPSANRINGLAALYLKKDDYQTAEGWCRKGLAIDPKRSDLRTNFALCRLQTGHPEEAEAIFAEMAGGPVAMLPAVLLNHGHALIALGRLDEAETQLDRCESLLKKVVYVTTLDIKGPIRAELATARAKIAELRGTKDSRPLEEL